MRTRSTLLVAFIAFFLLTGFFGPDGDNPDEQRKTIQTMKQDTLKDLVWPKNSSGLAGIELQ